MNGKTFLLGCALVAAALVVAAFVVRPMRYALDAYESPDGTSVVRILDARTGGLTIRTTAADGRCVRRTEALGDR